MENKITIGSGFSNKTNESLTQLRTILNYFEDLILINKIRRAFIKIRSWEYWPMWLVYLPASFYYVFLSIKARSFFFFTASNPSIENGGMFFESKWKIFQLIPKEYYPNTIFIHEDEKINSILKKIDHSGLSFPLLAKPDIGGRGLGVKKLESLADLKYYVSRVKVSFLIQTFVNQPYECSVFYYRKPGAIKGEIISFTEKQILCVYGDGVSSIKDLIVANDRAFLQFEKLKLNPKINMRHVLMNDEKYILVPYGNHVLGAKFINAQHLVDADLLNTFDSISKRIKGFYFGRYDLLCTNLQDLKLGKNISILELNGAGAEPAHIYDPDFSYVKAQAELVSYFKNMYEASFENHKNGHPYMTYKEFKLKRKLEKEYKQKINFA